MSDADVTNRVIVNLLLIAVGYLIKRVGLVSRDEGRILNRIVLYVTLPAVNLQAISGTELSWELLMLPVAMFVAGTVMSRVGHWRGKALDLSRPDMGTFVISFSGVMASLAYPFAEAAFGAEGVRTVAISDLGNAIVIFGIAYSLSFRYSENSDFDARQILVKVVTFFPMLAFLIAVVLNLLRVDVRGLPGGLIDSLAVMNSPLMLLSLGIYLDLDVSRSEFRVLGTQLLWKYGVGALASVVLLLILPFTGATRAVIFLLPLMPTSLSTLLYSVEQELNPRLAAMLISLTMVVSLVITMVVTLGFRNAF
ncbi:MAG: AEC family transporter [Anaerolineae bacterium]|nr:AEC family transporter [Anaerolineae bacterium]